MKSKPNSWLIIVLEILMIITVGAWTSDVSFLKKLYSDSTTWKTLKFIKFSVSKIFTATITDFLSQRKQ